MNTFSDDLRKERVSRDISLKDISSRMRINIRFLEAIEQGSFDSLPQTYVRAFLREYAQTIGLDPSEVLRKYDIMVAGKYAGAESSLSGSGYSTAIPSAVSMPAVPVDAVVTTPEELTKKRKAQKTVITVFLIGVTIALIVFVIDFTGGGRSVPTAKETPFQEIVKEQERQNTRVIDSAAKSADTVVAAAGTPADSLVLSGRATDTVWISVIRDKEPIKTVKLVSGMVHVWKAKDQFILSVSRANGVRFALEGVDIGPLGTHTGLVKNIPVTRSLLARKRQ
jgi:cytoskeletal protein RodZ